MHPKRIKRLKNQTKQIEKDILYEKPWYIRGGVGGKYLPSNSLLQSTPEFESASKANTIITQEHMPTIDNMIKLRVLVEG